MRRFTSHELAESTPRMRLTMAERVHFRPSSISLASMLVVGMAGIGIAQAQTLRVVTYNIDADINGVTAPNPGLNQVLVGIGEENVRGVQRPLDILALQ